MSEESKSLEEVVVGLDALDSMPRVRRAAHRRSTASASCGGEGRGRAGLWGPSGWAGRHYHWSRA